MRQALFVSGDFMFIPCKKERKKSYRSILAEKCLKPLYFDASVCENRIRHEIEPMLF